MTAEEPEAAPSPALGLSPGIRFMALGAFWFSIMSLGVKLAGQGLPSLQIVFVRAVITLALSYWLLRRAGLRLPGNRPTMLVVRGLFGSLALTCFYFSLVHLPLADATVIQYTNPVFTALLAVWVLGERMPPRAVALVAASLAGVLMVARPSFLGGADSSIDPLYVGIALLGALGSAAAYVTVRKLRGVDHPLVIVFYFPLVTVPLTFPFVLAGWTWPSAWEWVVLLGIGASTQVAQVYMTRGLQLESAGRATSVGYLQIVFAAVWGILIFAEVPDAWSLLGAAVIVVSTLLLVRTRGTSPDAKAAPMSPTG